MTAKRTAADGSILRNRKALRQLFRDRPDLTDAVLAGELRVSVATVCRARRRHRIPDVRYRRLMGKA